MPRSWDIFRELKNRDTLSLVIILIVLCGLLCCLIYPRSPKDLTGSGIMVHVMLAAAPPGEPLQFAVKGPFKVFDGSRERNYSAPGSLFFGYRLGQGVVTRDAEGGLVLNDNPLHDREMLVVPRDQGDLKLGSRFYRGVFQIRPDDKGRLLLLNSVDLERYLAGVLFEEMPASFPEEALKAQIVAARSYALFRMKSGSPYLTDDTRSQMYGGASAESSRSISLVNDTLGEVLTYDGEILPAYYSSTCGGISARAVDEFLGPAPPPVNHNRPCGYCSDSPRYEWSVRFTLKELKDRLSLPEDLKSFEVGITNQDRGWRAKEISILDGRGGIIRKFPAREFRILLNRNRPLKTSLLSTLIDGISSRNGVVTFNGKGWGHGVGLCQYGARGLARQQKSYKEILEFYYPGAEIVPDYQGY